MIAPTHMLHDIPNVASPIPRLVPADAGIARSRQRHDIGADERTAPCAARHAMPSAAGVEGIGPFPFTNPLGA